MKGQKSKNHNGTIPRVSDICTAYAHSVKHALAHKHTHTHTHTHPIIYVVVSRANEPRNSTGAVFEI